MTSTNRKDLIWLLLSLYLALVLWDWPSCLQSEAHYLPPVVEEYRLLANDWTLRKEATNAASPNASDDVSSKTSDRQVGERMSQESDSSPYVLLVKWKKRLYRFPIKNGFIAQSVAGNDVSDKDINGLAVQHIEDTNSHRGILIFKIASLQDKGPLFVRSLKIFDEDESFQKACKLGSPVLQMDAVDVIKLGRSGYIQRVVDVTARDWSTVSKRAAVGG